jgi:UDP-GlcNAc:undecaprenyl-phosphate GlcNAc-1-phosphate transferase
MVLVLRLSLPPSAMALAALAAALWLVGFVNAFNFLPWNADRVRVFLGDVGSYSIGAALAVLAVRLIMTGVPVEAVAGPVALYLADVGWTLQRRVRRGERWLEAHRTHVYQRWSDAGWSHAEITLLTSALTVLLCLLGVAGMRGGTAVRVAADLAGLCVLAVYLGSPGLFARAGLRGVAGLIGGTVAMTEMEET